MEIISDYIDLIAVELDVVGLEVEVVIKLIPEDLKAFSKFNDAMQNESWSTPVKTSIAAFQSTVNDFQYTLVFIIRHNTSIIIQTILFSEY